MRHLLCLTLCWLAAPSFAQQNSPRLNATGEASSGAPQYASGSANNDDTNSASAFAGETQAKTDGGQGQAKRSVRQGASKRPAPAIPNPFDLPNPSGMSGGGMEAMEGGYMDMEDMMTDMGDEGMEMGMGGATGMGMGMGMGMAGGTGMLGGMEGYDEGGDYGGMNGLGGYSMSPADQRFQTGLQRAIAAIRKSESEEDQKTLLNFVRRAFEERYDDSIQSRQKQLLQIKKRVAKLESELKRREAAKNRVVEVQLQSVQLAAEGLLELDGQ